METPNKTPEEIAAEQAAAQAQTAEALKGTADAPKVAAAAGAAAVAATAAIVAQATKEPWYKTKTAITCYCIAGAVAAGVAAYFAYDHFAHGDAAETDAE